MTRDVIDTAVRERIPFAIEMADGKEYEVQSPAQIAVARNYVVVIGTDELPHVLPHLTITGVSYLKPPGEGK
ncbi:MAG TPA: hypothetical protein VF773_04430 [Verrucomicrobiae bacterium]